MMKFLRRLLACLTCLALLPFAALAEDAPMGFSFDLSFDMDASAYPEADQAMLAGVADLLNILTVSGTAAVNAPSFDVNFDILLDGSEDTRTAFRLCGLDSHYQLESSLLGDQGLMMNNLALLEFAMKAYYHLELPLQYAALLVSPFAHTTAFDWIRDRWNGVMHSAEGSRVIPREELLDLAAYIAENAEMDRAFYNWVAALTLDLGYSDAIFESLACLPDWADVFLDEEGITVTVAGGMETWSTGDITLLSRAASGDGESWCLILPASLDGNTVQVRCARADGGIALNILCEGEEENVLLDADIALPGLPKTLPFAGERSLSVHLGGEMLPDEINLRWQLASDGSAVTLAQLDADTLAPMLTIHGVWAACQLPAPAIAPVDLTGINIFSVNDESLKEFVSEVASPFVTGMIPLLLHMPLSSYQTLFGLMEQYGILDLLTAGLE